MPVHTGIFYFTIFLFMNFFKQLRPLLALVCVVIITLIAVSLLDILIAVFYSRFYTNAAFIVTFGVAGVFAAAYGYTLGIQFAPEKNELARWSLISYMIIIGLFFFFFLSRIEGGEY